MILPTLNPKKILKWILIIALCIWALFKGINSFGQDTLRYLEKEDRLREIRREMGCAYDTASSRSMMYYLHDSLDLAGYHQYRVQHSQFSPTYRMNTAILLSLLGHYGLSLDGTQDHGYPFDTDWNQEISTSDLLDLLGGFGLPDLAPPCYINALWNGNYGEGNSEFYCQDSSALYVWLKRSLGDEPLPGLYQWPYNLESLWLLVVYDGGSTEYRYIKTGY
jgi:hypothetical protein